MVRARFSYLRNPKYRHNITFRHKFIYEKYVHLYKYIITLLADPFSKLRIFRKFLFLSCGLFSEAGHY